MSSFQETESLTSGCFYFPARDDAAEQLELPAIDDSDTSMLQQARTSVYQHQVEHFTSMTEDLLQKANTATFDSIAEACLRSHETAQQANEISTAVLLTGINIPDHESVFSLLSAQLQATVSPHCVILRSYECRTISSIMKQLVQRLLGLQDDANSMIDTAVSLSRLPNYDFEVLKGWYLHHYPTKESSKPLVVLLQDFEAFDTPALADFIISCSNHRDQIPIYLVLGVASTADAVHSQLPRSAITRLNIQRFKLRNSQRVLTELTRQVLMSSQLQLHMGWKPLRQLLDAFFFHDLSISNFVKGIKYSFFAHCSQVPSAALLDADIRQQWKRVKPLALSSGLKSSAVKTAAAFESILNNAQSAYQCCCAGAVCLNRIAQELPSLGAVQVSQQLTSWLVLVLRKEISETSAYTNLQTCLKLSSMELITTVIQGCVDELNVFLAGNIDELSAAAATIAASKTELEAILAWAKSPMSTQEKAPSDSSDEEGSAPRTAADLLSSNTKQASTGPKTMAGKRRQALRSLTRSVVDPHVERKQKCLDRFLTVLTTLCTPSDDIPGSKTVFCDVEVADAMQGQSRVALHAALGDATSLLAMQVEEPSVPEPSSKKRTGKRRKSDTTRSEPAKKAPKKQAVPEEEMQDTPSTETDLSTLPDLSIAYHLHLEGGKFINLHDWLAAFAGIVRKDSEDDADTAVDLQARFARAVSELQFLGLIKPTKRKQDHVARLTWGYV
eukprot:m.108300 g.108300  ORF g.108300 m.108300 type:complete len:729 (-) comp15332_c0_seq1:10-2196(-)